MQARSAVTPETFLEQEETLGDKDSTRPGLLDG